VSSYFEACLSIQVLTRSKQQRGTIRTTEIIESQCCLNELFKIMVPRWWQFTGIRINDFLIDEIFE
jgi:hypothetical protein